MICSDCREYGTKKSYCMRCYEECLSPAEVDAIYAEQIQNLQTELAQLEQKRRRVYEPSNENKNDKEENNDIDSGCAQQ